jgi:opacity protein-like surface antigen
MKKFASLAVVLCFAAGAITANAGTVAMRSSKEVMPSFFPYEKGAWEIQGLAGVFWDLGIFADQPRLDYALESLRVGYMVTNPTLDGWCRGNFEFLVEGMAGEFLSGPASYLVGGNLLFRWNFVQHPNPKWVPYVQIGGGGLYNDANIGAQHILGSHFEAMLTGGVGLRYHLNENWAVDAEIAYRHISNASTSEHNLGLNSIGGQIGVSYFFR